MSRSMFVLLVPVGLVLTAPAARADEKDAVAIVDKAIKAVGGEEKLSKANVITWKSKGVINFGGNESPISSTATAQGIDHYRTEVMFKIMDNEAMVQVVVAGDKGWRKFGDMGGELEGDQLANEKRRVYLGVVPIKLLPLKDKAFKIDTVGEEKAGGKTLKGIKATGPDGKEFKLYFDAETGLPVKMIATVVGFQGEDFEQTTNYADFKEFDGIKVATKVEVARDGEKFQSAEISDFKVLDKADPKLFASPE